MLNEQDNRSLFEIIDNLKRLQKEWIKKEQTKKECNMCIPTEKCWFHRSGKEHYERTLKNGLESWN